MSRVTRPHNGTITEGSPTAGTSAAGSFSTTARGLSRFMYKLYSGQNVTISGAGDSILEGTTTSIPGTNDCLSLIKTALQTTWGVTVTKNNRAVSGRTVALWMKEKWSTFLADNADLYILAFTTNDIAYDTLAATAARLQGYERNASIAHLESRIREIRAKQPGADILIMSSNPYWAAGESSNVYKAQWTRDLGRLATAYDCGWADVYSAFRALGNWDSYLSDGVHPNEAGHALMAATVLAQMPASWAPDQSPTGSIAPAQVPLTRKPLYAPRAVSQLGLRTLSAATLTDYQAKLNKFGTEGGLGLGAWTGSGPWTSSTAGDSIHALFPGCEAYLSMTLGADQGVIDIYVNGVKTWASVDLSAMNNGKLLALSGLPLGWNNVTVTVVSGSVTFTSLTYLQTRSEWVNFDRGHVTLAGQGATTGAGLFLPGSSGVAIANAGTVTIPFVGTGLSAHLYRSSSGIATWLQSLTIDGVSATLPAFPSAFVGYGAMPVISGLPYGKHTAVLTTTSAGFRLGGFSVFDESAHLRPNRQEGWAKQGDTVRLSAAFPTTPVISGRGGSSSTGGLITGSSVAVDSFVMGGPAGEQGWWVAETPDASGVNAAGF